ncbi:MAG: EamA family transporter, partial [Bacteroidaceae bacterium]
MWLLLAFISAILLGFYDVSKKKSVQNNAVIPVLFFSILFSSIIFTPLVLLSTYKPDVLAGTVFQASVEGWEVHKYIILKSIIVLSSWIFGYYG